MKLPSARVFTEIQTQLSIDDELDGDGAADGFFGGRVNCLVVGVGVQGVALVE